jgi:hypothetical protein
MLTFIHLSVEEFGSRNKSSSNIIGWRAKKRPRQSKLSRLEGSQGNFLELELLTHNINFLANIECGASVATLPVAMLHMEMFLYSANLLRAGVDLTNIIEW